MIRIKLKNLIHDYIGMQGAYYFHAAGSGRVYTGVKEKHCPDPFKRNSGQRMGNTIRIRRGYDIRLKGQPASTITDVPLSEVVGVKTDDYPQIKPKFIVSAGDTVEAGQCLFIDKLRPELQFTSPVSGEVAELVLGEKRHPKEIRILPDKQGIRYRSFGQADPAGLTREEVTRRMLESGCWNFIRQRPYSLIADPASTPKALFVSCFDSGPLAPDLGLIIESDHANFNAGLKALGQLCDNLHLSFPANGAGDKASAWLEGVKATRHSFSGPHPAGNVGIQIHHIDPIRPGDKVWVVNAQDVLVIGRLFTAGRYDASRVVALTGSGVKQPMYYRLITGHRLSSLANGRIHDDRPYRMIQGNVLTGIKAEADDFLSASINQLTVIPESGEDEFLGWAMPGFNKLSLSRSYPSWLTPRREYDLNTSINGEHRPFVVTGQYERVLPMDILPVHLLKAILAKDIEKMERLGIHEVSEEDFALCEFVCTSKIAVQDIIRDGLRMMRLEE